jgi:actin-related protein 9
MFTAEKEGEWEPCRVRQRERKKHVTEKPPESNDAEGANTANGMNGFNGESEEPELYEDWETDEGAVWAMNQGYIVNWPCFMALLTHVYNQLSPHMPIQTPILLIGQPCWSQKDHEQITQFFFEKFRCPGLTIMDSASAALYGFNVQNACIIDIGYQKADITAISDFEVQSIGRTVALPKCGGEAMTQNLLRQLAPRKFTRDMCEQLKQSSICEILPPGTPMPGSGERQTEEITNPAAAASTGATGSGPGHRTSAGAMGAEPRGPGEGTEVGDDADDNEGVLDVASIVAGGAGKMEEFLAKKEKEKAEKATRKKGDAAPSQAKPSRVPNAQREKTTFMYRDNAVLDALKGMSLSREDMADAKAKLDEGKQKQAPAEAHADANGAEPTSPTAASIGRASAPRREIEVGIERFQAASDGILERITDAVHHTISAVDVVKRSDIWDSLILVGRGSRVKGQKPHSPFHINF